MVQSPTYLDPTNIYEENQTETFHKILQERIPETGMITKILMMMETKFDQILDHIGHTQKDDNNPRGK